MARTQVVEHVEEDVAEVATNRGEVAVFQPPRLPYHNAFKDRFGVEREQWKALVEACYPNAKTVDSVAMVLSYCKARNLDPFKRPVHIVPMYSASLVQPDGKRGGYIDTIWPSIAELRTTAFRTGQYAGKDETAFGPMVEQTFKGKVQGWENGQKSWKDVSVTIKYPEWAQVTVYRMVGALRCAFVGPKVYWLESYATQGKTDLPNEMWQTRPVGQNDKCAEAAALRCAFPEELGNQYAAEEMEGRRIIADPAEAARDVTPQTASARKAPPPPAPHAAEQPAEVTDAPTTAPESNPVEGEVLPPEKPRAPPPPAGKIAQEDDGLDIPASLRRAQPPKAAPTIPNAGTHPEEFVKWAFDKMGAAKDPDTLADAWETEIAPRTEGLFPPDQKRLRQKYTDRLEQVG